MVNLADIPKTTWIAVTFAVAAIGFCVYTFVGTVPPPTQSFLHTTPIEVKRVISGNRIKLETDESVIYAGIRAPFRNEPLGEEAYELNRTLVEDARVRMRYGQQQRDRKDRLLAYVFVGDELVNRAMVRQGLAYVRLKAGQRRFAEELLAAQNEARAARRGLWKAQTRSAEDHYPADNKHATFHTPGCSAVPNTRPENRITFSSKRKAFDHGFAPCGRCKP